MRGYCSIFLQAQFLMPLIIIGTAKHSSKFHQCGPDFTGRTWNDANYSAHMPRTPNFMIMSKSVGAIRQSRDLIRLRGGFLAEDDVSTFSQVENQTDITTGETTNPIHGRFRLCVRRMDSQGGRDSDYRLFVPGDGPCRPFTETLALLCTE